MRRFARKWYHYDTMEPYQILLLVLVLVSFFYVSVGVYVLGMMWEFRRKLRRRMRGLNLLLYERGETLWTVIDHFKAKEVAFSSDDERCFLALRKADFSSSSEDTFQARVALIKEATTRVKFLSQSHPEAASGAIYEESMDLLEDLERNYRIYLGQYNMDVGGYNYWIKIPTYGWLGFLFGHRKKSLLS